MLNRVVSSVLFLLVMTHMKEEKKRERERRKRVILNILVLIDVVIVFGISILLGKIKMFFFRIKKLPKLK